MLAMEEPRFPFMMTLRKGTGVAHSRKEPTTNVASQERRAIRDAKKDIRVAETKKELEKRDGGN